MVMAGGKIDLTGKAEFHSQVRIVWKLNIGPQEKGQIDVFEE